MVKTIKTLISFLILFPAIGSTQSLNGTYQSERSFMSFNNDSVSYSVEIGCCLTSIFKGKSSYKIVDGRLLIQPNLPRAEDGFTTVKALNPDTAIVHVTTSDSIGASVSLYKKSKFVFGSSTDQNGNAKIPREKLLNAESISVSLWGRKGLKIPLVKDPFFDYLVKLDPVEDVNGHRDFISGQGAGFELKLKAGEVWLRYVDYSKHKHNRKLWHRFVSTSEGLR
jgi:hypothetical protein